MKTYYLIRTLLAFFICTVTFASTCKDSLAVGKRTRTFATAPAVATHGVAVKTSAARGAVSSKGVNSGSEIITTKGKLVLVENGADVGIKFINTTQKLTTVVVSTMPTLTRVTTSGITVTKNVDKTVTILGKYNDDIRYLLDDLEYPKTLDFEAKKNGYNLLNAPDELYLTAEQFWLQFNKPFLDKAILRGDDIVLATNPTDAALNVFDDAGSIVGRSGFGREYDHLLANGYVFDDVSKKMVNAGSDLFSSFTNLKNLPIEVKTFLSNKNWDNALLTELDGDLVNTTLKNAIAADETLIDSWKKLDDLNVSPAFRQNLDNLSQRSLLDEYAGNISTASNARKGNFGEIGADLDLNSKGYESLQPRITSIDEAGHNGLDGVYRSPNGDYIIIEGKYTGSASLNPANANTGLDRQMSDDWIASRDWEGINIEQGVLENLLLTKNYKRIVAKVEPDGTVTYQYVGSTGYLTPNGPGAGGTGPFGIFDPLNP